ncbi:MAG: hypothetical protein CVV64_05980 [Candidatus Wallbacteria bacterium HGW-Wallbacteria-1]|jgi:hypothetical protein|uniref:YgjP-like metallopeptidase domain-containing protein n=1 Tax=Candidatus Wallbacteria bacterium HGW-Wallbacteria-1 TaxID=2013854 RepID=A0A2N1PSJ8_9BACT|nr:MAG: hypothetical protein CVV64_05980 [Candidatus Wallbacteria bacterium HGW-Wallbacteria-1]
MSSENSHIEIKLGQDKLLCRHVRSSRRRTLAIEIDGSGDITVRSPDWVSIDSVRSFLNSRKDWIISRLMEIQPVRKGDQFRIELRDGAPIPLLGEKLILCIEAADDSLRLLCRRHEMELKIIGRGLTTHGRSSAEWTARLTRTLRQWFEKQAYDHFGARLSHFSALMGVRPSKMVVGRQKGRWGSCSIDGVIRLNWRLMMAGPEVVDYVIVHELAHIRVHNHSSRFWKLVENHYPDYAAVRRHLRKIGAGLMDELSMD